MQQAYPYGRLASVASQHVVAAIHTVRVDMSCWMMICILIWPVLCQQSGGKLASSSKL